MATTKPDNDSYIKVMHKMRKEYDNYNQQLVAVSVLLLGAILVLVLTIVTGYLTGMSSSLFFTILSVTGAVIFALSIILIMSIIENKVMIERIDELYLELGQRK
jgi:hypothetical protein